MDVRVQHQGLAPGVQGGDEAGTGTEILRITEQLEQGVAHGAKQQRGHLCHIAEPQGIEVMRDGEDHMVVITAQESGLLCGELAFNLEKATLRAAAMLIGVIPDATDVAVGTRLDVAT